MKKIMIGRWESGSGFGRYREWRMRIKSLEPLEAWQKARGIR
jgi:hypothetical protein